MIPKIIHLCWLSGDPFPADILKCLETWNDKLKDYTIWLWGKCPTNISVVSDLRLETREFDLNSTVWTRQAFEAKKYAFAADYIRLYALYNYGGIYLDADVLVYKNFDELLSLPYFIGCDQIRAFEAAVIGAEQGCTWIKDIFDTYKDKEFIKSPIQPSPMEEKNNSIKIEYDMMELPVRFHHVLTELEYQFVKIDSIHQALISNQNLRTIYIFGKDFFNSRDAVEVHPTKKSFCAHNYAGSWQSVKKVNDESLDVIVKRMMPKWMLKMVYIIGQKTWARNKYRWFQIPFER